MEKSFLCTAMYERTDFYALSDIQKSDSFWTVVIRRFRKETEIKQAGGIYYVYRKSNGSFSESEKWFCLSQAPLPYCLWQSLLRIQMF